MTPGCSWAASKVTEACARQVWSFSRVIVEYALEFSLRRNTFRHRNPCELVVFQCAQKAAVARAASEVSHCFPEALPYLLSQKVHVPNSWVLGIWAIIFIVQYRFRESILLLGTWTVRVLEGIEKLEEIMKATNREWGWARQWKRTWKLRLTVWSLGNGKENENFSLWFRVAYGLVNGKENGHDFFAV